MTAKLYEVPTNLDGTRVRVLQFLLGLRYLQGRWYDWALDNHAMCFQGIYEDGFYRALVERHLETYILASCGYTE